MFAGLLPFAPECLAPSLLPDDLAARLASLPPDAVHQAGASLWMPARLLQSWLPRDETLWHRDPDDGTLVAFWGRLDNRDPLAGRWGDELRRSGTTDAARIAAGWRRDGEALVEHLVGEFAFAVVSPATQRAMLARDPVGVKPISYRITPDGLWVGSSLPLLRALVPDPQAPDSDWVRRYLLQQSWHDTRTAFGDILRLAPGHVLTWRAGAPPQLRRWFAWRDDAPSAARRDDRWVDLYREKLEQAVRCRWDGEAPVGVESSAGIDSSALVAILASQVPDAARRVLSMGIAHFDAESLDILGLSRSLGLIHNHVMTRADLVDEVELRNAIRVLGHPEENGVGSSMARLHEICRLMGVRHLFSGFGGDEAASQAAHPLRRELLDAREYRALFEILPGNPVTRTLRFGRALATGLPALQRGLLEPTPFAPGTASPFFALSKLIPREVIDRLGVDIEARAIAAERESYRTVNAAVLGVGNGLGSPHVSARLESCTLVAAARGLDYHWPLLDTRLVQQYLSTPAIEKGGPRGMGRYLHRRAMDRRIPERITWRVKKDTGQQANRARLQREAMETSAQRASLLASAMHPQLADILALPALRDFTARALAGTLTEREVFPFQRFTRDAAYVNLWLNELDQRR